MEQSPSWEPDISSISHEFPTFFEDDGLLPHSRKPATVPILSQINPVHASPVLFLDIKQTNSLLVDLTSILLQYLYSVVHCSSNICYSSLRSYAYIKVLKVDASFRAV